MVVGLDLVSCVVPVYEDASRVKTSAIQDHAPGSLLWTALRRAYADVLVSGRTYFFEGSLAIRGNIKIS